MAEALLKSIKTTGDRHEETSKNILNIKLSSLGIAALFAFLLLENPLETLFPVFGYYDEILFAAISFLAAMKALRCNRHSSQAMLPIVILLLAVACIGVAGAILSGYQHNYEAVLKDILAFVKFPVTLVSSLYLSDGWDSEEALGMCSFVSKVFIVVCFTFCLVNLVSPIETMSHDVRQGIVSFKFLFSHPTFLVLSLVLSFSVVLQEDARIDVIKVMCLITLAFTMRDKAFGFIGLVVTLWLFRIQGKKRLFPYLALAAVAVLVVAWPKIEQYLSWASSPREAMYLGAFQFALAFFPFGSGFGTFASALSGEYYSSAYFILGISDMEGLRPSAFEAAGDNGIAYYIGQFGVLGAMLCVAIAVLLCRDMFQRVDRGSAARLSLITILGYLAIALTVESTLTNASGVSLAVVLALIASKSTSLPDARLRG